MELVDRAKTSNDFGLRKLFPWTGSDHREPWTKVVTSASERSYVKSILSNIFLFRDPLIKRVENPYLWSRYVLSWEELNVNCHPNIATEHRVIHATSLSNAMSIADTNFDWRRVNRGRFGQGVSFATNATYAQKYASGKDVYIIAGIPIVKKCLGNYFTKIPTDDYDTTGDPRGFVRVKYYDSDFYPYWIVQ